MKNDDECELVPGADGPILSGETSLEEASYGESVQAILRQLENTPMPGGLKRVRHEMEFYDSVEHYDPVLLWHCRLVPVLTPTK